MKVSVALCTFNGEKFIKQQIDSIIQQSKKVDEVVVCDDGSTDKTLYIIEKIAKKNPYINFKLYRNKKQLGSIKNFEKAINYCINDVIFLSDQDDLWIENKVEKILDIFTENENIDGVFTDGYLIDENGNVLQKNSLWDSVGFYKDLLDEKFILKKIFGMKSIATGATMAFKKKSIKSLLPIPLINDFFGQKIHHDYWIAHKLSMENKLLAIDEKLICYRIHKNQQLGLGKKKDIKLAKKNFESLFVSHAVKSFHNIKKELKIYAYLYSFYQKNKLVFGVEKSLQLTNYYYLEHFRILNLMKIKYPILSYIVLFRYKKRGVLLERK